MKSLVPAPQNDAENLDELSQNERLTSYPLLGQQVNAMKQRYIEYVAGRGDPWNVADPLTLPNALVDALKSHYTSPPKCLGFLAELRESGSPDVCAMCGSLKAGTLDHVLPKDIYPEFAIFAPNLVPACDCNSKRGTRYRGLNRGERTLHPYFDDVLRQRLVYVGFSGDFNSPLATIEAIGPGLSEEQLLALRFHIDSVLERSSLLVWASGKWASLCRDPEAFLQDLPRGEITADDVRIGMEKRLNGADREHRTPNNWYSMLFYGVLHSNGAIAHVCERVAAVRLGEQGLI
ncbi:TPA: hypothetical protein QDA90_001483 [Burkholderia vietnamiensis]|nr:hypothetical protein [Burkholderia vietnamiensis]HDR8975899.1 hypothetical protein [Burkholderia vietnamiensis]HDR9066204.1 hypothetical protein [Burkholderia vietnamiensis]